MSTYTVLDLESLKNAVRSGGPAGLTEYVADDIEFTQIDQSTPPGAPAHHTGRDSLIALAEDLERRGIRMQIDDGFIAGDRGALRLICTYPDGNQVVEHSLLTLHDGKIARWAGVQAWDS